ncbi:MAG: hypothetical protein PUB96_06785 [Helicobacteraceae bacterium]|nr:hypothetical protein [Helicobacteraceae bacterium]
MEINVFLPCRAGSQRVKNKNTKAFGGHKNGLLEIKLKQLLESKKINKIYLSSDDCAILAYAKELKNPKIITHKRDSTLASSTTSTDSLITHAKELMPSGEILWTHVTSPFVKDYDKIILAYEKALKSGFDSLMSVYKLFCFLWDKSGSINYNRALEKWPRTQTLKPLFEVNSAAFLANSEIYKSQNDRIGKNPYLYEMDKIESFDIDWEEDFVMGDLLYRSINGGGGG